ncbi:hypothetical protein [Rugamonas rubra]|uniref:Uncharacterized protein n=1 Tax=Rugamonas rubra TaxID=758825 RepID=A0A1I4P458_9BURK|nr:hypothetical protein [Rugamonas rubra]SFM22317.1 hypothetical protein SAMN02982985_03243 [Rugamonas rubra]
MFRKQLYYLSSEQLCAYQWRAGRLSAPACFTPDPAGIDAFMDYVEAQGDAPIHLLADLIEEDFQRQLLPHVRGGAGRRLRARRLLQQYRDTPYRHLGVQGRDAAGRRDDIVLLCALTNPAVVQPWIAALEQLKAPLAGLYSATLLSAALLPKLALDEAHLLLVSQQSAGLRQSYFQRGQLKFSRLTPALDRDGAPVNLAAETGKTQQFLTSVRLLGRGEMLHTVVLAPAPQIAALEALCRDGAETSYRFVALAEAAARLGLAEAPALAEPLLLHLLAAARPAGHYALGEARRYFLLRRARLALSGAAAAVCAGALLWSGANLWNYVGDSGAGERLAREAEQFDRRYQGVMADLPPSVAKTANMKAAVTVERMVAEQAPQPQAMMAMLSAALDKVPQVSLLQLDWAVKPAGAASQSAPAGTAAQPAALAALAGGAADGGQAAPLSSALIGIPGRPPQTLRVEAEIAVSQDNYRSVLEAMNRFTQELARQPRLLVQIEQPPLDTRPNVKLSGKAGTAAADGKAKFILNLVLTP